MAAVRGQRDRLMVSILWKHVWAKLTSKVGDRGRHASSATFRNLIDSSRYTLSTTDAVTARTGNVVYSRESQCVPDCFKESSRNPQASATTLSKTQTRRKAKFAEHSEANSEAAAFPTDEACRKRCLLYTSDAADE